MPYGRDILEEPDPALRMQNLRKLIADREPTEILVLTAISILSEDEDIRRVALERLDERNRAEGDTSGRVAILIQSWRREGALMTWPQPMNDIQAARAARIESAHHVRAPLVSVTDWGEGTSPVQAKSSPEVSIPVSGSGAVNGATPKDRTAPAEPTKSLWERIVGVLFDPADTFADIARRPDILAPLLLLIAIGYATTAMVMPKLDTQSIIDAQTEAMRKQNPNLATEDLERVERFTTAMTKVMGWLGPLLGLVWWVIVAAVLLLAFKLLGGEGKFKQAMSATLYAWIPLTIFGIILTIVVVARGTFDPTVAATIVKSNPAFLTDMKEQPVLFSLLSSFDVFTIWTVILLAFGFAALSGLSRVRSMAIVISLWVVMIVIKVGFAALGAARMNG